MLLLVVVVAPAATGDDDSVALMSGHPSVRHLPLLRWSMLHAAAVDAVVNSVILLFRDPAYAAASRSRRPVSCWDCVSSGGSWSAGEESVGD
jgi:hypothetical protein